MSASLAVSGLLGTSTGSALLRKVLFQVKGNGLHGQRHTFEKPWFTSWESAAACWVSILIFWIMQSIKRGKRRHSETGSQTEPLLSEQHSESNPNAETKQHPENAGTAAADEPPEYVASWKEVWALIVPGLFSVASIIVQGMGLRYISASLSLMLSGSCIIFTAILSVLLLKCRLNQLHLADARKLKQCGVYCMLNAKLENLAGIALSLAGIAIVSLASLVWPEMQSSTHHHNGLLGSAELPEALVTSTGLLAKEGVKGIVTGILLTLLSMLILAMRLVSEEFALQGSKMHSLQVLGYEGMWGTLVVGIFGLPLAQLLPGGDIGHCQENTTDSFLLLGNNLALNVVNWFFFFSVIGLNIFGLMVTQRLGSVFRAVLLTSRTASVWVLDLILFYTHVNSDGALGEPWAAPASWFQLFGFALLLLGTVIYAQGSSAVAQDDDHRKLTAADPEVDGGAGGEDGGSPEFRTIVSAVTRLRPYTSLYIPHGPRNISRRTPAADAAVRRSLSMPQVSQTLGFSPPANGAPTLHFDSAVFERHSYTPGLLEGSSPRSLSSVISGEASLPAQSGMRHSASSLFVQSLTHRSSWVLPFEQPLRVAQRHNPSSSGVPEDDIASPGLASAESPSTSRFSWRRKSPFAEATTPVTPRDLDVSSDAELGAGKQRSGRPRPGQSPSPQSLLEFRRSARRSNARMPPVEESDAEAPMISFDEMPEISSSAPSDIQPLRSESTEQPSAEERTPDWQLLPLGMPEAGQKHIYGQSPAAPVLLSRRSTGRSKQNSLPAFSESPGEDDLGGQQDPFPSNSAVQEGKRGHKRNNISGSSSSSRSSMLGQSPTPAKLLDQRSAEKRSISHLPAFKEEGAAGRPSSSSSSSLDTSDEDERFRRHPRRDSEGGRIRPPSQQGGSPPTQPAGLQRKRGSTTDLWNGEPMSL